MTELKYKDWNFEVEKELTEREYSKLKCSSAESCGCGNCLNYIEYRNNVFPKQILDLLKQLGIDFQKEIEVSHFAKLENGLHYYSGWFHFIGSFDGKDCSIELPSGGFTIDYFKVTENFGIGFTKAKTGSLFNDNRDLIQIEFEFKIPWVLKDVEEGF